MTFSIVARCDRTGELGVAAVTARAGVGKLVCYARPQAGAIATQAFVNPFYGIDGLKLLADGQTAAQTLDQLRSNDPQPAIRQVGMIDHHGRMAAWTGEECADWAGHLPGDNCMAQGNRLVGPQTLQATVKAFHDSRGEPLARRLLLALEAGQQTGADRKGASSANIYVYATEEYPLWDMRVDYAKDPIAALHRLYREFDEYLVPNVRKLPTRAQPAGRLVAQDDCLG